MKCNPGTDRGRTNDKSPTQSVQKPNSDIMSKHLSQNHMAMSEETAKAHVQDLKAITNECETMSINSITNLPLKSNS